ncbi:MAG TPA: HAD family hydrolase, partial [Gammaproteobacteria bacterium]|nr:HAD family hydrolase [Gammaproteobacteria bacterium]
MSEWSASSSRVDAVLFDLGNTLVSYYRSADFAPVLERCVAAAAEILRERPDLGAADTAAAYERALAANVERADHRVRPLDERLLEVFGLDARRVPGELLARLGDAFLGPIFATARLDASAVDVLSSIKQLGIKTAIVSNTPWGSAAGAWRAELARHGLRERVDAVVFCVDVGWRKPAPQAFARALELLGVAAQHAWFVGDDPGWDVAGARAAGLRPILVGPRLGEESCEQISTLA